MKTGFHAVAVLLFLLQGNAGAQSLSDVRNQLRTLTSVPAITGHEQRVATLIADQLKRRGFTPRVDAMSNVTLTLGSGKPHRLLVANIDEPGYIVSGITDDGYLRMQRVGTARPFVYFDQFFEGQRLTIQTAAKAVTGVLTIPSTHLARGSARVERPFDLVDAYIDIGAKSSEAVSEIGVRILDPISIEKTMTELANDRVSAPFLSDRAGAAVLMSILSTIPRAQINGTVTFAFTTQEHFGRKGLDRMTVLYEPDEVYLLEPLNSAQLAPRELSRDSMTKSDGSAVSVDVQAAPAVRKMLGKFDGLREAALQPVPQSPQWKRSTEVVRIGIPILFYATPVEVLDLNHLRLTIQFLRTIVQSGVS